MQAREDQSILTSGDTIKVIGNIMKTNVAACTSIGAYFNPQIGRIYSDMLQMYRAASALIDEQVKRDGEYISPHTSPVTDANDSGRRHCYQNAQRSRPEDD